MLGKGGESGRGRGARRRLECEQSAEVPSSANEYVYVPTSTTKDTKNRNAATGEPQPRKGVQPSNVLNPHVVFENSGLASQCSEVVDKSCMSPFQNSPVLHRTIVSIDCPNVRKFACEFRFSPNSTLEKSCMPNTA